MFTIESTELNQRYLILLRLRVFYLVRKAECDKHSTLRYNLMFPLANGHSVFICVIQISVKYFKCILPSVVFACDEKVKFFDINILILTQSNHFFFVISNYNDLCRDTEGTRGPQHC